MNLLNLDEKNKKPFSKIVEKLIQKNKISAEDIFMNVLESEEEAEMNYWMTKVLVQEYFVPAKKAVAKDAAGEPITPLQGACLLNNIGMVAALLELNAFTGAIADQEFQTIAKIAETHKDEKIMSLLTYYTQSLKKH